MYITEHITKLSLVFLISIYKLVYSSHSHGEELVVPNQHLPMLGDKLG